MTQGEAADWIVRRVGDVARPRETIPIPRARELPRMPGRLGVISGLETIVGMFHGGNDFFLRRHAKYGDVFKMQFGPDPIVSVVDPEAVNAILKNEDGAWSAALGWRTFFHGIDTTSDTMDMLIALDFAPHRDARRLMQPAFSGVAIRGYIRAALEEFEKAMPSWTGTVEFKPAIRRLFATVAGRIFMDVDDPRDVAMLDDSMQRFWGASMAPFKTPMLSRAWRRGIEGFRTLFERLRGMVDERRRGPERPDLFTRLCQLEKTAEWIDDAALVRLFISIMIAAFDTTSFGVTSMAYLLARHPEWQERLRAECRKVPPDGLGRDELGELEQMEWAWKETLRVLPIVPDVPRRALREVDVGGYRLPAGTMVLPLLGTLGHHPKYWSDPSVFDPERFSPARAEHKKHKGIYVPFGGGAHTCIGSQLAEVEAKVFFHKLLSSRRIRLADPKPLRHQFTPLGCVTGPVKLVFEKL